MLTAIKQLPPGMHTAYRYNRFYPDKPGNLAFGEAYNKLTNQEPTDWAWQNSLACQFIFEALKRTGGKTEGTALAAELAGMKVASPFAVADTIDMRESDHTIIGYPVAWGRTITKVPYVTDFTPFAWSEIIDLETQWKATMGYA